MPKIENKKINNLKLKTLPTKKNTRSQKLSPNYFKKARPVSKNKTVVKTCKKNKKSMLSVTERDEDEDDSSSSSSSSNKKSNESYDGSDDGSNNDKNSGSNRGSNNEEDEKSRNSSGSGSGSGSGSHSSHSD